MNWLRLTIGTGLGLVLGGLLAPGAGPATNYFVAAGGAIGLAAALISNRFRKN